jgi:hypothetical protein
MNCLLGYLYLPNTGHSYRRHIFGGGWPNALHAQSAYLIWHGPHPTKLFLLQDRILEIAQTTQAQAVYPGCGFFIESAGFC